MNPLENIKHVLCSKTLVRVVGAAVILLCYVYWHFSVQQHSNYLHKPDLKCNYTEAEQKLLVQLAYEVHSILDELEIGHWLMYGALLGALRVQKPLSWDYDVDIGVYGEQFTKAKKNMLFRRLKEKGISYYNHLHVSGLLKCVKFGRLVELFLFYEYKDGMMKRTGWEPWLFFIHYRYWHTFPAALVKPPLPKSRFGFFNISIPRNGNEITKYIYRNDWREIVKPLQCR